MVYVRSTVFSVAALVSLALLGGCQREAVLRGDTYTDAGLPVPGVVDIAGHPLPGVAVSVRGAARQAVTDSRGQYRVNAPPGYIEIDFYKTGYTPGLLQLEIAEPRTVEMTQAVLRPLPDGQGVFFFRGNRYQSLTRAQPRRYLADSGESIFGSKTGPLEGVVPGDIPVMVAFRLPGYDVQLARLRSMEAKPPEVDAANEFRVPVWVSAGRVNAHVEPLDEPRGMLLRVVPDEPLVPGVYAVHWGAFEGHLTTESRAFLFEVRDAEASIEAPPQDGTEAPVAPAPKEED
jgi:hypothetical protein